MLLTTGLASGIFVCTSAWSFADELTKTPAQTEGPFYPDKLPLDTDNDLLIVNNGMTAAVGTVSWLSGRVLDLHGNPIRNALVEIWQCDNNGAYIHTKSDNGGKRDGNFQGFGRFLTGSTGEYLFRTIKPVPYPGRAPHIHVKIKMKGKDELTSQIYVKGDPGNPKDGIWKNLGSDKMKAACTAAFDPIKGSKIGELAARCDLVLGMNATSG
jgi:protocatechuate 3,4-dioxygenase beta subunit